jgi:preprotein translocase subunit SecG
MNILINLLLVIWMIVALLMILVILMQRPKSEGLGAAFGGGVTENIFGAQTTTVLTKITGWLAGIFFALTFTLSVLYAHKATGESALSRELKKSAALPQTSATPILQTSPSPGASASIAAAAAQVPPAPSVRPADAAVGAVPPASAPVAPSATVSASPKSKPKQ